MLQGLSVGGEYTSSMVFLVEQAPAGRRGLMGALASCGAGSGILLGSAVGAAFAATMSTEALDVWGWRIPFLLGLVVGIIGYFLRRHVQETTPAERRERAPIVETLHDHWRLVLRMAGLSVFNAVTFYVAFVYLVSWLQLADGIAPARALEINSFSMAAMLPLMIVTGLLADRFGRKPFVLLATILGFVGAVPLFLLMNHPSPLLAQLGQLGFVLIVGLYGGVQPTIMAEMVPAQVRCTAVALGYNICLGVIGGLTPLVATWLVERTGDEIAPALLIMAAAAVAFMAILRLRETYRAPFIGGSSGPAVAHA
jgi:MHS family proline/betaine transporter-like MFS transporter